MKDGTITFTITKDKLNTFLIWFSIVFSHGILLMYMCNEPSYVASRFCGALAVGYLFMIIAFINNVRRSLKIQKFGKFWNQAIKAHNAETR